jgi:hypothetical protein
MAEVPVTRPVVPSRASGRGRLWRRWVVIALTLALVGAAVGAIHGAVLATCLPTRHRTDPAPPGRGRAPRDRRESGPSPGHPPIRSRPTARPAVLTSQAPDSDARFTQEPVHSVGSDPAAIPKPREPSPARMLPCLVSLAATRRTGQPCSLCVILCRERPTRNHGSVCRLTVNSETVEVC